MTEEYYILQVAGKALYYRCMAIEGKTRRYLFDNDLNLAFAYWTEDAAKDAVKTIYRAQETKCEIIKIERTTKIIGD